MAGSSGSRTLVWAKRLRECSMIAGKGDPSMVGGSLVGGLLVKIRSCLEAPVCSESWVGGDAERVLSMKSCRSARSSGQCAMSLSYSDADSLTVPIGLCLSPVKAYVRMNDEVI